ncbi:YncE family protein [Thermosulfuriphilus sp.]
MLLRGLLFLLIYFSLWGSASAARINVFLNIVAPPPEEVSFRIKNLYLIKSSGQKIPLSEGGSRVFSTANFAQEFLAAKNISPGEYQGLILEISDTCLGEEHLDSPAAPLKIRIPFRIRGKESLSLFVFWNVRDSLQGRSFIPQFYGRLQGRPLRDETLYVTCDDIDTLFAIRADTNQVVASLGLEGGPKDLAISLTGDRLYIVASKAKALNVVELSTFRTIDTFFLPLAISPQFIALLGGNQAVVTDPQAHYLLLINLVSGGLISSRRLGYQPSEILYWEEKGQIFVSSPADQVVYILNADLSQGGKLTGIMDPRGLWIKDGRLYVAEYRPGTVSVFNLDNGELVGRIRSGRGTIRVSGSGSRLYISNEEEGTIGVISPGQLTISKKIRVKGSPFTMATYKQRRWLYVADRRNKGIIVIDITSEKPVGRIILGGKPFGMIVNQ